MSVMSAALKAKLAKAKTIGPDMNESQKGGGYTPPEAGKNCRIRFIGYYEGGTHVEQSGAYAGKKQKKVKMDFELCGGPMLSWSPVDVDGKMIPKRIALGGPFGLTYSLNEKATFYKLFKTMSDCHPAVGATIMAELLGLEFICDIEHKKSADGKRIYANIVNIRKAEKENDAGTAMVPIVVPDALTEPKFFIHDIADLDMWNALFIEGAYEEEKDKEGNVTKPGKSKNVIQEWIRSAIDFDSSPIGLLLNSGVKSNKEQEEMDASLGGEEDTPAPAEEEEPDLTKLV